MLHHAINIRMCIKIYILINKRITLTQPTITRIILIDTNMMCCFVNYYKCHDHLVCSECIMQLLAVNRHNVSAKSHTTNPSCMEESSETNKYRLHVLYG